MDHTTKQNNTQMSPDALAATLAHATHLHEQLLPDVQNTSQNTPQAPQEPQGEEQTQQPDVMAGMTKIGQELMDRMDKLEKEIKKPSDNQEEIDAIRAELDKLEQNG